MNFLRPSEQERAVSFLKDGYVIQPAEDGEALNRIRNFTATLAASFLGFLLPNHADDRWRSRMSEFAEQGTDALFQVIEPEVTWLEVPYGQVVVFTPTVMHGNRINREATTRSHLG